MEEPQPTQPQVAQDPLNNSSLPKHFDIRTVQTIFPQYIDANLTPSEGRRLTKAQSVEFPQLDEMVWAVKSLGYKYCYVDRSKSLPCCQAQMKFTVPPRGCIRVPIKAAADQHYIKKSEFDVQKRALTIEGISSKHALMQRIAELIKSKGGERPKPASPSELLAAATPGPRKK